MGMEPRRRLLQRAAAHKVGFVGRAGKMKNTTKVSIIALLLLTAALGGCETLGYLFYLVAPASSGEEVHAEFTGLADSKVAIVIYADAETLYNYPYIQLELSSQIAEQLRNNVEGVTIVDIRRVIKYQQENLYWESMDKTELGKVFTADNVLFVALVEFSTREPGSVNLYRGRVAAQAGIYNTSLPERQALKWNCDSMRIAYPRDAAMGEPGEDDSKILYETQREFAVSLVKKFHNHKAKEDI